MLVAFGRLCNTIGRMWVQLGVAAEKLFHVVMGNWDFGVTNDGDHLQGLPARC